MLSIIIKIIDTVKTIAISVFGLLGFFKTRKKNEEIKKQEEVIVKRTDEKIDIETKNKNIDHLNELAGWKD